jgi:nucleotide-binding universal stress UspA family protein
MALPPPRFAVELASATGSRLCVCSVWPAPLTNYAPDPLASISDVEQAEKVRAYDAARAAAELAEAEGVPAARYVREGDPVDVVSQTAAYCRAGLVVVGSHGWGPIRRLVFGSVSTALLHHAPCPVLVVRAKANVPGEVEERKEPVVA